MAPAPHQAARWLPSVLEKVRNPNTRVHSGMAFDLRSAKSRLARIVAKFRCRSPRGTVRSALTNTAATEICNECSISSVPSQAERGNRRSDNEGADRWQERREQELCAPF